MAKYYYSSNKYSIKERKLKSKVVYDVIFRIINEIGEEKQQWLCGYPTKKAAKEAYMNFIQNCEYVPNFQKKEIKKNLITINAAFLRYVEYLKATSENKTSTVYDKIKLFNMYILPKFGKCYLPLSKDQLTRWQNDFLSKINPKTNKKYTTKYFSKVKGHLSVFLNWCEQTYGFQNNIKLVKNPPKRTSGYQFDYWTIETFKKFIAVVDDPTYRCLFKVLFGTGRRKGEVLALSPTDIDFEKGTIIWNKSITRKFVRGIDEKESNNYLITSTKEDKSQTLQAAPDVIDAIKEYMSIISDTTPFLFGGSYPLADNTIKRRFLKYCEIAGVKPIRIHDLRHSFVSMLLHNGANYQTIATLISDTTEQVISTYSHIGNNDINNAIMSFKF